MDTDAMGRLLLRTEADAHRGGWDAPAALFVLYDARDAGTERAYRRVMGRVAPATRCGTYAAQQMVPPPQVLDGWPQHALFRMALNFSSATDHPDVEALLRVLRQPGFLGVAFRVEAWLREARDDAERESWGARRFADMPGSREVRNVHAADVAGRDYVAQRIRGEKPKLWVGDGTGWRPEGSVVESLRMVAAVVAGLPRPELTATPTMWSRDEQRRASEAG